jgi:hypothetical protein
MYFNCPVGVNPTAPWRIAKFRILTGYRLKVYFLDGLQGELDISKLVQSKNAGIFAKLRDPTVFKQVFIHYGVLTWPGEIDIAPDAMHEEIKSHGKCILE